MITPSFALNLTTASLDPRVTFTRVGNTATIVNASGFIESVNADTPRFNYNPITLACNGLLIEESRTNLCYPSDTFGTPWVLNGAFIDTNVTPAPTGTSVGSKLREATTTGGHSVRFSYTKVIGVPISFSVYAKADQRTRISITVDAGFGNVTFDLSTGTIVAGANGTITNAGNGWYRCSISKLTQFSLLAGCIISLVSTGTTISYTGVADHGAFIWGAQFEDEIFPTSYIPTTTGAVTRNADVATMTGTNFSDFWQATRGGASVLATPSTVSGIRPLVQFDDNTANEIIALRGNTTNPELYIVDGGTPQAQIDAGTIAANTPYSLTGWWQENNSFAQINTQVSVRDNTVTIPTVTQARIGSDGTNYLNGTIAAIYYYDELANSIYDSLRLLGYTGTVTDMLLQYYLARGATSNSLTDAEIEFLGVKGFTTGTIDDRWTNYLISLGYSGTITDMKYQYWKSPE
jgi:hypothetical protein